MESYVRAADLPCEEIGGGLVIVDVERDYFFSTNSVGAFIWELLDSPRTAQWIADRVVLQFDDATEDQVKDDVTNFIGVLHAEGLIETHRK